MTNGEVYDPTRVTMIAIEDIGIILITTFTSSKTNKVQKRNLRFLLSPGYVNSTFNWLSSRYIPLSGLSLSVRNLCTRIDSSFLRTSFWNMVICSYTMTKVNTTLMSPTTKKRLERRTEIQACGQSSRLS